MQDLAAQGSTRPSDSVCNSRRGVLYGLGDAVRTERRPRAVTFTLRVSMLPLGSCLQNSGQDDLRIACLHIQLGPPIALPTCEREANL